MSTDLAVITKTRPAVSQWDQKYQELVKLTVLRPSNRAATGAELALFAEQCVRTGLNPFLKQIYGIYRFDKRAGGEVMTIQTGIDGFRLLASRNTRYNGQTPNEWCGPDGQWTDVWLDGQPPAAARVGVFLKGAPQPVYAVALWREYVQKTRDGSPVQMWRDMPANQLAKCAEALALRKACPAELSGITAPEEIAAVERVDPAGSAEYRASVIENEPATLPVAADAPSREQIAAAASQAVENGLISMDNLLMLLTSHGAVDSSTIDTALDSLPAEGSTTALAAIVALEPAMSEAEVIG